LSLYLKIILILFGLAYLISPVDIIPDLLLPYIGWIDDGIIFGTIVYLIRYGRLPNFFFKKSKPFETKNANSDSNTKNNHTNDPNEQEKESFQDIPKNPYDILGVRPSASKKEIQTAYKEAIKKYHPDKLSHLGEEFSNLANKKFLEIQNAYDTVMKA